MPVVTYVNNGRTARVDVPDHVATEWNNLCYATSRSTPVDSFGRRLRPYPALDVASHRPYAPAGVYVDHRDPVVERSAYELRDRIARLANGERQAVLQGIADRHGLRHWRDAYNTVRNVGRRVTGESGRNQAGELVWRRWSSPYTRTSTTAATVRAAAAGSRCIGVELEFNHNGYVSQAQTLIAEAARHGGMVFVERWGSYGRNMSMPGWQGTYDSTVSGGEVISDILAGDDASLAEVRDMLAIIRDHGGVAGERQGVHVHHDARDFSDADKVRIVDNLRVLAPILDSYLPRSRRNGYWCGRMDDYQWTQERASVAARRGGSGSHNNAFNFGHLYSGSPRVEFRSFGHSLNSTKLRCWIRVGQAIMAATKAGITFGHGTTCGQMLGMLRSHGLSAAASTRFADTVANRGGSAAAA